MPYKYWLDILQGKPVEGLDKFPVSPEVRKRMTEWLHGLNLRFFLNEGTETLVQDIIDARFGGGEGETGGREEEVDEDEDGDGDARMEV